MGTELSISTTDPGRIRASLSEAARSGPTARDELTGAVWVFGYEEIERLGRDRRLTGIGMTMFDLMGIEGELHRWYGTLMFANEGDQHVRLRRLVSRAFTPRAVERLRVDTAASVTEVLDDVRSQGEGDLVAAFSSLPIGVMCRLLGVPTSDIPVFTGWLGALSLIFGYMEPDQIRAAESALGELLDYAAALVASRRHDPGDDLITALLRGEDEGDSLSRDEVVAMVSNLLVAGYDTTTSQVGCSLLALLSHPHGLERIRRDGATVASAVAETQRYEPNVPGIARSVVEAVEVGGIERPPGTFVILAVMAGNRDPAVWDDPDHFDVARFDGPAAPKLLSFGTGPHFCLGASLARMTLEEVVRGASVSRLELTVAPEEVEWRQALGRTPVSLPVKIA